MPQEILRQSNSNGGELDPTLHGRRDLKAYFNSAAIIENLITLPQGPMRRRPGLTYVDRIRRQMETVSLAGATLAAPNGGTAANALAAGDAALVTATALEATDPYVVLTIDLGAPQLIHAIDCIDYGVGVGVVEPPWEFPWGYIGGLLP